MTAVTFSDSMLYDGNDMPWDEAIEPPVMTILDDIESSWTAIDDTPSDDWRKFGVQRRKQLVEEEERRGRLFFDLNLQCHVEKYFEISSRAMEQFLTMYKMGEALEETYVMGNRMITFLTEYLTAHPGFHMSSTSDLRKQSFRHLEVLQNCLDDLAMRIDEAHADRFVENFDPLLNETVGYDSDEEFVPGSPMNTWVKFGSTFSPSGDKFVVESPTRTVDTSGSDSLEVNDNVSSDDYVPVRRVMFSDDVDEMQSNSFTSELKQTFQERDTSRDFDYETDSEAIDSWEQGGKSDEATIETSSSIRYQNDYVVCDPAKSALAGFRVKTGSSSSHTMSAFPGEDSTSRRMKQAAIVVPLGPRPVPSRDFDPCTFTEPGLALNSTEPGLALNSTLSVDRDSRSSNVEVSNDEKSRPRSFREKFLRRRSGYEMLEPELHSTNITVESGHTRELTCPNDARVERRGCPLESVVISEIEKFLDSSIEYDPTVVFESSMGHLNAGWSSKTEIYAGSSNQDQRPFDYTFQAFEVPDQIRTENNAWVYFD